MNPMRRRRSPRLVVATVVALMLALACLGPRVSQVRAVDICSTSYCASIQIVQMADTGSGHITSDPAGIDCTETTGNFSGTCYYVFDWTHLVSSIYVDMTITADSHSYVCMPACTGIGGSIGTSVALNPGDHATLSPEFKLGTGTTLSIGPEPSTGSGRVTSDLPGIDCRIDAGVKSGTCFHSFWYVGSGSNINLTYTPDAGSFGCAGGDTCGAPDVPFPVSIFVAAGSAYLPAAFWVTVPVTVNVSGSGKVVSSPAGVSCPSTCSRWFSPSADITLSATPATGWAVKSWGGACSGVPASLSQCSFHNSMTGAAVSIVFQNVAAPTPLPHPTSTPRPIASPTVTRPPATPVPAATPAPSGGTVPFGSGLPSPGAAASPPGEVAVGTVGGALPTQIPLAPGDSRSGNGSFDPSWLLAIAAVVIAALVLGLAIRRRSRVPADRSTRNRG